MESRRSERVPTEQRRCVERVPDLSINRAYEFFRKAAMDKPLAKITLNVFPGGFNWPSFVAQALGFFAGNEVTLQQTPNSVAQMTGLSRDEFQIAMTAVDNVVAYVEGQGEAPIGPQPDFFALMGSDSGFLSLVAQREVKSWRYLKGKTLSGRRSSQGPGRTALMVRRPESRVLFPFRLPAPPRRCPYPGRRTVLRRKRI
jgi:hypothetical protein